MIVSEKHLEDLLVKSLKNKGFEVYSQVPLTCKRVDIAYFDHVEETIISIEVKLTDWKKALEQAYLNKYNFHKSYVAFYWEYVHRIGAHFKRFEELGIGLYLVDANGNIEKIIDAENNATPNRYFAESFYKNYLHI